MMESNNLRTGNALIWKQIFPTIRRRSTRDTAGVAVAMPHSFWKGSKGAGICLVR